MTGPKAVTDGMGKLNSRQNGSYAMINVAPKVPYGPEQSYSLKGDDRLRIPRKLLPNSTWQVNDWMTSQAPAGRLGSDCLNYNIYIYNVFDTGLLNFRGLSALLPRPRSLYNLTLSLGHHSPGPLGGVSVDWQVVLLDISPTLSLIRFWSLTPMNQLAPIELLPSFRPVSS